MDYVYMLRCRDGSLYTGWTNHLLRRLRAHNAGRGAKYTKTRLPVQLIYVERLGDKSAGLRREYEIKQLSREQKQQLIQEDQNSSKHEREQLREQKGHEAQVIRKTREIGMGKIFYLMGKSATGKDTIYERLLEMPELTLKPLIIYTTRPMREGERDGETYHFTDEKALARYRWDGRVIEERAYRVVSGVWYYYTVDDGSFDDATSLLGIGTPESFSHLKAYFGSDRVIPLYIDCDDRIRIHRALDREDKQQVPHYEEMCRRYLADQEDFSEEKLMQAGISQHFENNRRLEDCVEEIADEILASMYERRR